MVVQHNLTAMNSSRMLGITTGQQAKASEKLSSGYQINRAADDAAGLSISEKMRKQIKGLDRSSMNAQDGVSSVQTAEGALAEVHSMLQRMNELSIQAANGTNSKDDRDAIQSEIAQLSTEIDRVAETTKFNETYLLKGQEPMKRHYPKAHDAGLVGKLTDGERMGDFEIATFWPDDKMNIGGIEYTIGSSKEDAENLITSISDEVNTLTTKALNASGAAAAVNVKYSEADADYNRYDEAAEQALENYNNSSPKDSNLLDSHRQNIASRNLAKEYVDACDTLKSEYLNLEEEIKTLIEDKTLKIGKDTYTAKYNAAESPAVKWYKNDVTVITNFPEEILPVDSGITVEYTTGTAQTGTRTTIQEAQADAAYFTGKAVSADGAEGDTETYVLNDPGYVGESAFAGVRSAYEAKIRALSSDYAAIEAAYGSLVDGRQILVGDRTYTASYTPDEVSKLTWEEHFSGDKLSTLDGIPLKLSDKVHYEAVTLHIMTDESPEGTEGFGVDDNIPTLITKRKAYEYIQKELLAANNIGTTAELATVETIISEIDRKVNFVITKGFAEVNSSLKFGLHVGSDADATNKIQLDIETMNCANLGIEGINVSGEDGLAGTYAIDAITDAIERVSEQRSSLGAIQNRLEHTIANLDNVVENTTDAESRIRDTDMAEEMVEYSKNNILAQAGQSMLAQANQSTQGVLSLLQ